MSHRSDKRVAVAFGAYAVFAILATIVFWGAVIFVALHFILKAW